MYNVALVDDCNEDSELLQKYFKRFSEENGVEFRIFTFNDADMFFEKYTTDCQLVIMDIELPGMDGIEACKKLRQIDKTVVIIFVTNMAQYAVNGYEVEALDFVIKPVTYYDFALKLTRAVDRMKLNSDKKIKVKTEGGLLFLNVHEIRYVEVIKHVCIFHMESGIYKCYSSLKSIESELTAAKFVKCNSCYLVNLRFVTAVKGHSCFLGDEELLISHPKRKEFLEALNNYLGGGR